MVSRPTNTAHLFSSGFSALCCALLLLLTACGGGESNVVTGNRDGVLHYGNGTEPQGLDPHVVTGVPENHIIRALFEGLAVKNPITLEPEPGVAERWEFSDEGRVITFYLNPDAKWSNGEQVTASDYVWSWNRALHPMTGNEYSYMLFPLVNAEAYLKGKITDFNEVGVKALDDTTLEVTLNAPTPYFVQLMDHYSTFAVHPETLMQFGEMTDRYTPWTRVGNIVSNGAFTLTEWSLNRRIIVEKSEHYWDRDKVSLNAVVFYPMENVVSEERMFRVEQLHYTQVVPLDKIPLYRDMLDTPYVQAPYLGTYYYLINTKRPPLMTYACARRCPWPWTATSWCAPCCKKRPCPPTPLPRRIRWGTTRPSSLTTTPNKPAHCLPKQATPMVKAGRGLRFSTTPMRAIEKLPWPFSKCGSPSWGSISRSPTRSGRSTSIP